jgi:peptidoglycan/LPS O-acetylase OafA/YrhL
MVPASPNVADVPRKAAPIHLTHVEGLRALAAYVVFINHAFAQVWEGGAKAPPGYLSLFTYSMVAGHLSVTVFIVISGFCLMLPVVRAGNELRGGTLGFFKRRARRILPPYYGAVALCLALIWTIIGKPTGTLWDFPLEVSGEALVSHLFLVQDLFATARINYVFWSIAVEWHIYFLFPLLVWSWRRFGPKVTVIVALTFSYAVRIAFDGARIARANPHYLGLFALGMLAAYLTQTSDSGRFRPRERFPWAGAALVCVALVCVLTREWGWRGSLPRFQFLDLPIGIAAMCLLVATSRGQDGPARRFLSWKPLAFIGTFSYSVYLVHAPFLQIIWQYVMRPLHLGPVAMFATLMGPGALAILCVAYAFFRVFEEPFMRQTTAKAPARPALEANPRGEELPPVALHDRSP